ncbi:radical SAM protein [Patescibacteria group bacterium]|nr:radical SAM protein [Patescibacteria group bacterium]
MENSSPNFYVQWHITDRCSQRCRHCYLFQSKRYSHQQSKELKFDDLSLVVEDIFKTAEMLGANAVFVLTGGDPILHPDFWRLLEIINIFNDKFQVECAVDILGNPFYVNSTTASRMKKYGVRKYQLSLDGLEEKHNFLRSDGGYQETLRAARVLRKAEIRSTCMFTLSRFNAPDLIEIMKKIAEEKFDAFAFARFCRPSNWSLDKYKEQMFSPSEYKKLLTEIYNAHQELAITHPNTRFVFKDHLWELFFYEKYSNEQKTELDQIRKDKIVAGGCGLGVASLSILSDGAVYACRRFPSPIGKVPNQSLIDLFINSKQLNKYRDLGQYKKCKNCPLLYVCRGCGAVAYGVSGSFFDADPQCWQDLD